MLVIHKRYLLRARLCVHEALTPKGGGLEWTTLVNPSIMFYTFTLHEDIEYGVQ
jgi:hypothetical protein